MCLSGYMKFVLTPRTGLMLGALITATGCATPPKPSVTASFGGMKIYSTTADMQSSFMKNVNSGEHFCDSRASDVADTESVGIGISGSMTGEKAGVSDSASSGAVALGGRSPNVLITREVMYRTCEMVMNLTLDKEEALDLYIKTLDLVKSLAQNDTNAGTSSIVGSASAQNIEMIDTTSPPAPLIQESSNSVDAATSEQNIEMIDATSTPAAVIQESINSVDAATSEDDGP
jgi:hypothetical protein